MARHTTELGDQARRKSRKERAAMGDTSGGWLTSGRHGAGVTIGNGKGGVGTTTTPVFLDIGLARAGRALWEEAAPLAQSATDWVEWSRHEVAA